MKDCASLRKVLSLFSNNNPFFKSLMQFISLILKDERKVIRPEVSQNTFEI